MTAVTNHTSSTVQFLTESSLRRRLNAELHEIRQQLEKFGVEDDLSKEIQNWSIAFSAALKITREEQPLLEAYIGLMQKMLLDSMSLTPLDDQPLLGSDKRTYGYKHLCIYLNSVPEEYRHRSPLDPHNTSHFATTPHTPAQFMIKWLDLHQASPQTSEKIDRMFANLSQDQLRFIIPNQINDRMRRIWKLQQQRDCSTVPLIGLQERTIEQIDHMFHGLNQRIDHFAQEMLQQENKLSQQNRKEFDQLQRQLDQLSKDIEEQHQEIEELHHLLGAVSQKTFLAEKEELQIKINLKELEKAIKEKERELLNLCLASASITACAIGTWAISGTAASMTGGSATTSLLPIKGGAKLGISVFF